MSTQPRIDHPAYGLLPSDVEGFDSLAELALDLRWSWNHATDGVWRRLDPALWELTHNPWVVLQTVSRDKLRAVLVEPAFRKEVDSLVQTEAGDLGITLLVSKDASRKCPHLRRLLQHGVHAQRSVADLLGRSRQCGRRSAQGQQ